MPMYAFADTECGKFVDPVSRMLGFVGYSMSIRIS